MTRKILLTVAVAFTLLVVLAGLVVLASFGPVFAMIALVAMVANGFFASDLIGVIWNLEGQYDEDGLVGRLARK